MELSAPVSTRIDTSTFTRPKHGAGKRSSILQYNSELQKRKTSLSPSPHDTLSPRDMNPQRASSPCVDPPTEPQRNGNSGEEENGNGDENGLPMWHRLADVEDVQVMARMQEESK